MIPYEPINATEQGYYELLLSMGFTRHSIDQLYAVFLKVDVDASNSLSPQEWFIAFETEPTTIVLNFLKILDMDGSGVLNFTEFIFSCWNFLTLDLRRMGGFVFLMCDSQAVYRSSTKKMENAVDIDNFCGTLLSLHAKSSSDGKGPVQQAIAKGRKRWKVTALFSDQVQLFCYENQSLITPLIKLRDKFRDKLISRPFWEDMTAYRNDSEEFDRYDYVFVVRNELIRIDIECTKREEKEARAHELATKRAKGMRPDKRSFIQKHFGMHRNQIAHAKEKPKGSHKRLAHEGTTDWDQKVDMTKKNKHAVKKRLDEVNHGELEQKPNAMQNEPSKKGDSKKGKKISKMGSKKKKEVAPG